MKEKSNVGTDSHRRNRSRRLTITAAGIGMSMLLAACAGSPPPATSASPGTVSGPLSYWYGLATSDVKSQNLWKKYNLDAFQAQYPSVQLSAIPNSYDTIDAKLKVALAAGSGPDIVITPGSSNAIPYGTAGYLADLTANANANNWKDKILPWALDMGYIGGKLEALPTSYETLVVYYNKTLFDANGWAPPTDRASLETLAGEMQAKGITPFAAGNASYQPGTEWLVSAFLNEVAGPSKVYSALNGTIPWTDPAIVSSIQLLKDYFDKGYFGGGVKQYFSTQDPQKYAGFADGKAGMYISGSWEMNTLPTYFGVNGNKDEWAWAPLPALAPGVPSNVYPLSVGGTISVNAKSKNIPAATAYVNWLFSDTKNMWAAAVATGSEPLPVKFAPTDVPSGIDPRYAAQYQAINDASVKGNVGYVTWTSFGAKADTYIVQNMDKVLNQSLTVADFCAGVEKAFSSDKAAGLIPPLFKTGG